MGSAAASPALKTPAIFSRDRPVWGAVRVRPLSYFVVVGVVRVGFFGLTPTRPSFPWMSWMPAATSSLMGAI
jgi:hypothetical protein